MAQRENLPEGTDTIITGASDPTTASTAGTSTGGGAGSDAGSGAAGTGGSGIGDSGSTGGSTIGAADRTSPGGSGTGATSGGSNSTGSSGAGSTGGTSTTASSGGSGGGSESLMEKVRSGSQQLSGQAADKARGFVGQGIERSAEALTNVSRLVGDTAEGLEEKLGPEFADYARRASSTIDEFANGLRNKDPDELIDDTREFVRKSPTVALAGAAIVGFALARMVKSGLAGASEVSGQSGSSSNSGSGTGAGAGTASSSGTTGQGSTGARS